MCSIKKICVVALLLRCSQVCRALPTELVAQDRRERGELVLQGFVERRVASAVHRVDGGVAFELAARAPGHQGAQAPYAATECGPHKWGRVVIAGGDVGIGTNNPSTKLEVAGTITETSMRESKINIENIENILPAVLQMQGVKFDWKDDKYGSDNNYGLIAEDVDKILPNLVSHDNEGKARGIQYTKLTAVLLEAIKEQQEQINDLKSKIGV